MEQRQRFYSSRDPHGSLNVVSLIYVESSNALPGPLHCISLLSSTDTYGNFGCLDNNHDATVSQTMVCSCWNATIKGVTGYNDDQLTRLFDYRLRYFTGTSPATHVVLHPRITS